MRLLILIPLYALMLFIASAVTVNAITFEYMGICPPALARAEFERQAVFIASRARRSPRDRDS